MLPRSMPFPRSAAIRSAMDPIDPISGPLDGARDCVGRLCSLSIVSAENTSKVNENVPVWRSFLHITVLQRLFEHLGLLQEGVHNLQGSEYLAQRQAKVPLLIRWMD